MVELIAPKIGGIVASDKVLYPAQQKIDGGPSVVYDAVAIIPSAKGAALLASHGPAKDFVTDAHRALQVHRLLRRSAAAVRRGGRDAVDGRRIRDARREEDNVGELHQDLPSAAALGSGADGQEHMRHQHVVVAIPARNEAEASGSASARSTRLPQRSACPCSSWWPPIRARTTPFDDRAIDNDRVLRACRARGSVGSRRARRVPSPCSTGSTVPADHRKVWIANTDADCLVPPLWLRVQLGARAPTLMWWPESSSSTQCRRSRRMMTAFTETYILDGEHHGHVHAANIGMCGGAYRAVGGWCLQTVVGEDHVIWGALRDDGRRMRQTTRLRVITSARTRSRVLGGFATDLDNLGAHPLELMAIGGGTDVLDVAS